MLSLLKKKSDASGAPLMPSWHPNFRNFEKLPDTKVVRTAFFINGAAISVALALGIYFGLQEWRLASMREQIAEEQRKVDQHKGPSDQAVARFKKFVAEEARTNEVDAFIKAKPQVSALLMRLGATLPPNIAIDNIDIRDTGMLLRLSVRGAPETAPGYATAYRDLLAADQMLTPLFEDVIFTTSPTLNPATGRLVVEFLLKIRPPAPAKKS